LERDRNDEVKAGTAEAAPAAGAARAGGIRARLARLGLSDKLLLLTSAFVMLAEVLIFVPSIANFRVNWLNDRLTAAAIAALAAEAVPGGAVPQALRRELLDGVQALAIAVRRGDQRLLVLPADGALSIDATYDLRPSSANAAWSLSERLTLIVDALMTLVTAEGRVIRVVGRPVMMSRAGNGETATDFVEIVLPQDPLQRAMLRHSLNILLLSLAISGITATLVYIALKALLVRPMQVLTRSMLHFSRNPEDASRVIEPSARGDEIGTAERELAHLQRELHHMLHQRSRLAQLGLAVSKINHDLRNMLASAQLISDRLAALPDPTVQRFAPKLIASLDRAIDFCNGTLRYGRSEEAPPRRAMIRLHPLAEEVAEGLGLPRERIGWTLDVPTDLEVDADPDHIYRILNNLVRNAVQVLEVQAAEAGRGGRVTLSAGRTGTCVTIEVADDGPGVPEAQRPHLFRPFQATNSRGGSGLGLAIAAELAAAHGGTLVHVPEPTGALFRLEIPDREA
jgi:signal transduction histidine kinase